MFFSHRETHHCCYAADNIQVTGSTHKASRGRRHRRGLGAGGGREYGLNEETHGRNQHEVLCVCGEMGNGDKMLCNLELGGCLACLNIVGSLCVEWNGPTERA